MVDSKLRKYDVPKADMSATNVNKTYTEITFYKQFNLVICNYHIVTTTYTNTVEHTILAQDRIPIDFRPPTDVLQSAVSYSDDVRTGLIGILANGRMYMRMGVARTSLNVYGSIVYAVEN